ncbi:DUF4134 domain-containing protein [Ferruginibacter paludis]|uniref:DUF4134 domain-containing protein n=1 Tax=Ferruginibacter paludis TaxID=1310417 RepID=UPI003F493357
MEHSFKSSSFKIERMKSMREKNKTRRQMQTIAVTSILMLVSFCAAAQDGNAGINEANTKVRSYFASGTNLMYAVGAIVGLIGAIKVYQKWNSGDHDTGKVAAAWFGSCVFLVIVATVIRSFFGV